MHLTGLDFFLWASGLLGNMVLLSVLYLRRLVGQFPLFTALIATSIVKTLVLFAIFQHASPRTYFVVYWLLASLDLLLQLSVAVEVTGSVFRPFGTWEPELRRSSCLLIGLCLLAAAGLTWLAAPPATDLRQTIVLRGSLFSAALLGELFVAMSALSVAMHVPWKSHAAHMAQGLGAYSILDILLEGVNSFRGVADGTYAYVALSHLRMIAYQLCVVYWIAMLAKKLPEPKEYPEALRKQMFVLQARLAFDLHLLRSWKG